MKEVNIEELVQDKDEICFLFKLKNQIMMSLLNHHRVKIPGLGTAELRRVKAGNRYKSGKSSLSVFKIHLKMDENLRAKLENQRG